MRDHRGQQATPIPSPKRAFEPPTTTRLQNSTVNATSLRKSPIKVHKGCLSGPNVSPPLGDSTIVTGGLFQPGCSQQHGNGTPGYGQLPWLPWLPFQVAHAMMYRISMSCECFNEAKRSSNVSSTADRRPSTTLVGDATSDASNVQAVEGYGMLVLKDQVISCNVM